MTHHLSIRALALVRRPWVAGTLAGIILGGILLLRLPLFGLPGFELAAALTLTVGILGTGVGMAAARQERQLLSGTGQRPTRVRRIENPLGALTAAAGAAMLLLLFALLLPFLASLLFAYASTRCNPFSQLLFFPLLTLPAIALAACTGVFCGLWTRRVWGGWLMYGLLLLASFVHTLWPIWSGPQVFAFNFYAGYFPGPLYDEALRIPGALLWFRLETLALAAMLLGLAGALVHLRTGELGLPGARPGAMAVFLSSLLVVLSLEKKAEALGLRQTEEGVVAALGGTRMTSHLILHFPRSLPSEAVERLLRDAEFRIAEVEAFLGESAKDRVRVFVYASPEQKGALIGAGHTQISKPWQHSVHINASGVPHPALKHELVHALSSSWGQGPFRLPGGGFRPSTMGIVEGLAVAADPPRSELTLEEEAAALRRASLAPDLRRLFDPIGFYATAGPRAYTLAGAFIAYLRETYGRDKLKSLYGTGDFSAAYGRDLNALALEWERHVDGIPLSEKSLDRAVARYRQESLFARPCAREVAQLSERASEALPGQPEDALDLYTRCAQLQPEDPRFTLGRAAALERLGRVREADGVLGALEVRLSGKPSLLAEVTLARADLARRSEGDRNAEVLLLRTLSEAPPPEIERTAWVKLYALRHPSLAHALLTYFDARADELRLLVLERARQGNPDDPVVHYLLGRRLIPYAPAEAAIHLGMAAAAPLPEAIKREASRQWLTALYLSGDCKGVKDATGHLPDLGSVLRAEASEWQARCAFDESHFSGPLVPDNPFR